MYIRVANCILQKDECESIPATVTFSNLGRLTSHGLEQASASLNGISAYESDKMGDAYNKTPMSPEYFRGVDENDLFDRGERAKKRIDEWKNRAPRSKKEKEE